MPEITEEQMAVIRHVGSAFVSACPGSGKTHTLVERFAARRSELDSHQGIAVVSFTNSAAEKLKEKLAQKCGATAIEHPNFVGTFDQFINRYLVLPFPNPWHDGRTEVVDTWERIQVDEIRPRGFTGMARGLRLDDLQVDENNALLWDANSIEDPVLRAQVLQNEERWKAEAERRHSGLLRAGYITCKEARNLALANINSSTIGNATSKALAARFSEVLVDEAQDCNADELTILRWVKDAGIPMILVADINQCIYQFRGAKPDALATFVSDFPTFSLTVNFRSSQAICDFAKTLKMHGNQVPDRARYVVELPVHILPYSELEPTVHDRHKALCRQFDIPDEASAVIAHARVVAHRAAGRFLPDNRGINQSPAVQLAFAAQLYQLSNDAVSKHEAVSLVEGLVLRMLGAGDTGSNKRLAEQFNVDFDWLRMSAVSILSSLPSLRDVEPEVWLATARGLFAAIHIPAGLEITRTPGQTFRASDRYSSAVQEIIPQVGTVSTIHGVKGLEYEAVLLVLPKNGKTRVDFTVWNSRNGDVERIRALYVAATRAKKLLSVAVHQGSLDELKAVLDAGSAKYLVV